MLGSGLIKGLKITFQHLFEPAITYQYPYQKAALPKRSRGRHLLPMDENGIAKCTSCMMCVNVCPDECIVLEFEKNPDPKAKSKRLMKHFEIDYEVCSFCGLCVDVCNFDAIIQIADSEFPTFNKEDLHVKTDELMHYQPKVPMY